MFGIDILDVAIGLFFGYLVLSLVVTAANEMSAAWFRRRAWMLHKGVSTLLDDEQLADKLYDHPLVKSLSSRGSFMRRMPVVGRLIGRGPSYIPSRTFAMALLDVLQIDPDQLQSTEDRHSTERVLALLWKDAGKDRDKFGKNVETWFNDSMERVSGWYKRRTQLLLLMWAAVVTIGTNADTLVIAKTLGRDPALRQALVQRAEGYVATQQRPGTAPVALAADEAPPPPALPPDQQAELDFVEASEQYNAALADLAELQLPIGWEDPTPPAEGETSLRLTSDTAADDWPGAIWEPGGLDRWLQAADEHSLGWLLTILAVSMGAPFWFDMLNRIMSVRTAGKAPEEAQKAPKQVPEPREAGEKP
jgi:hypothetical protein